MRQTVLGLPLEVLLHILSMLDKESLIQFLLVDITFIVMFSSIIDNEIMSALYTMAVKRGDEKYICQLWLNLSVAGFSYYNPNKAAPPILHLAVALGQACVVRTILTQGIFRWTWREPDNEGNSVVHLAAKWGHVDILNQVLKHLVSASSGDIVNMDNDVGMSPLYLAVMNDHVELVEAILNTKRVDLERCFDISKCECVYECKCGFKFCGGYDYFILDYAMDLLETDDSRSGEIVDLLIDAKAPSNDNERKQFYIDELVRIDSESASESD